jgi:two-component system NarL family response regulator
LTAPDKSSDVVRELIDHERRFHEAMQRLLYEHEQAQEATPASPPPPVVRLSSRELEILRLVTKGATNQEIGRQLSLSPGTVRNYNGRIFRKLGVEGRTEAAVRALELRLVNGST